jgi:hypothetical protein
MEEEYTNRVYIPPYMQKLIDKRDSLKRAKENERLLEEKRKNIEDSDSTSEELLEEPGKPEAPARNNETPKPKTTIKTQVAAILNSENKKYKRTR